ncbi:MAG: hypothetical protein ACMXX7_03060 [Candidatus Woesearchaeota archaeon]
MSILDFFKRKQTNDTGLDLSELDDLKSDLGLNLDSQEANPTSQEDKDSFGNIRPKKREEELPSFNTQNFSQTSTQTNQVQNQENSNSQTNNKDTELILSKLDTIRTELTNIHHRLDKIEEKNKRSW